MYINGAIADPDVKIINAPNNDKKIIIGASHHFFLTFKKSQSSRKTDILLTVPS